ncbi:hypothetical protein SEVIR_3G072850v4 [Setaria viridis]
MIILYYIISLSLRRFPNRIASDRVFASISCSSQYNHRSAPSSPAPGYLAMDSNASTAEQIPARRLGGKPDPLPDWVMLDGYMRRSRLDDDPSASALSAAASTSTGDCIKVALNAAA